MRVETKDVVYQAYKTYSRSRERDEQLKIRNEKKHPMDAERRLIIRAEGQKWPAIGIPKKKIDTDKMRGGGRTIGIGKDDLIS